MAISHRDQIIGTIDEIDIGMALLRTAYLATSSEGGLLEADIEAIASTLYRSLMLIETNRMVLHSVVQEMTMAVER